MRLCLYLIVILIGVIVRPRNKILEGIPIILMCILLGLSHDAPDYNNYQIVYDHIGNGNVYTDTGIGWYYFCRFGNLLGLDYRFFSILIYLFSMLLINHTVKIFVKSHRYRFFVWSLFLIYPALLDAVQIRFFLAQAIVFFGFKYLLKSGWKNYCTYIGLCLLAFTVHTSTIFYLVFLLGPVLHKVQKYLMGFVALATVAMLLGRGLIYNIALGFVNDLRVSRYFSSTDSIGPFGLIAYLSTLYLFWMVSKYCYDKTGYKDFDKNVKVNCKNIGLYNHDCRDISNLFYQMSMLIWMVMPLTLFDTNFFRLQRPMWLMLYIVFATMMENGNRVIRIGKSPYFNIFTFSEGVSILGFVFYICVFNFNVVYSFLL